MTQKRAHHGALEKELTYKGVKGKIYDFRRITTDIRWTRVNKVDKKNVKYHKNFISI